MHEYLLLFQIDLIGIQIKMLEADRHCPAVPVIPLHIPDPVDLHPLQSDRGILFSRVPFFRRGRKSIHNEPIVPNRVCTTSLDDYIMESYVAELGLVLQKEPISQGDPKPAGIQEGVTAEIPHQCAFQLDPVEEGNAYMPDAYLRPEHGRKPGRSQSDQPLLDGFQSHE